MTDPRKWVSRIRREEPPELWEEVGRRVDAVRRRAPVDHRAGRAMSPRLAALATGLVAGALALILVIVALREQPEGRGSATPSSASPTESPTVSPTPAPKRLDPVTLTASLDEPPAEWTEVAFVPAGEAESEIGYRPCSDCVLPVPAALAVGPDGSFWIADPLKERIAHFGRGGSFLGAVPVPTGPADLTFVGDRLYVLFQEGGTKIAPVDGDRLGDPIRVNHEGRALHVEALIGGQGDLLVLVSGAENLLGGYWGFASIDAVTGQITPSLGVLTHQGTRADFVPSFTRPATYELRWALDGRVTAEQDYRFQLVRDGLGSRATVGDMYLRTRTGGGVATLVSIGDGQGEPVGVWYLEISALGKQPIFERVEATTFVGNNRRYLTFGPDGVYLMRLLDDGVHILRR